MAPEYRRQLHGNSPPANFAATYNANNQIALVSAPMGISISYDAAGNVTNDGYNTYLYDAEGRVCAVHGPQGMMGYLYNAEGNRVGKGMIANMNSCDPTQNGFVPTNDYVLDQSGGQMTEVAWANGTAIPQHTNVTANGVLIATSDSEGWHFHLNDPLGSRRIQADAAGFPEQSCQSLPFGDQLFCTGSAQVPTEHHFTGKERDAESGNDYFGARYYGSNMGRFMSPDWSSDPDAVPFADLSNPQSLNLYSYVQNNPLTSTDPDGHEKCPDGTEADVCVTATPDPPVDTTSQSSFGQIAQRTLDVASQAAHQFTNIMNTPGGPGCMGSMMAAGGMAGAAYGGGVGLAGLAGGGVAVVVTEPAGLAIGGVGGALSGGALAMTACPGGAGNGGGSGSGGSGGPGKQGKFWKSLKSSRQNIKTNGLGGSAKRFFQFDYTHGDVEVYDGQGQHLGSADPETGEMTKPAVPGRRLSL